MNLSHIKIVINDWIFTYTINMCGHCNECISGRMTPFKCYITRLEQTCKQIYKKIK